MRDIAAWAGYQKPAQSRDTCTGGDPKAPRHGAEDERRDSPALPRWVLEAKTGRLEQDFNALGHAPSALELRKDKMAHGKRKQTGAGDFHAGPGAEHRGGTDQLAKMCVAGQGDYLFNRGGKLSVRSIGRLAEAVRARHWLGRFISGGELLEFNINVCCCIHDGPGF